MPKNAAEQLVEIQKIRDIINEIRNEKDSAQKARFVDEALKTVLAYACNSMGIPD